MDWLFRRLQRLDTEGYAIQNLADPKTNPFNICSQDLFSIASEFLGGFAAWTIPSFLSWYFDGVEGRLDVLSDAMARLLHEAAHVWWRLEVPHEDIAFLMRMFDPRLSLEERLAEAERFLGLRSLLPRSRLTWQTPELVPRPCAPRALRHLAAKHAPVRPTRPPHEHARGTIAGID